MRRILLLSFATLVGCSDAIDVGERRAESCALIEESPPGDVVTLSTFWTTETADGPALAHLRTELETKELALSTIERPNRTAQQESLRQWLLFDEDQIPDVFQGNSGSDFFQFVEDSPQELCPLGDFLDQAAEPIDYLPAVVQPLMCRGDLFALPIGVHRVNVLFANRSLYESAQQEARSAGITFPDLEDLSSAEQFVSLVEEVAALQLVSPNGTPIVPLTLDTGSEWPVQLLAHDTLLSSYSLSAYRGTWMGRPDGQGDAELEANYRQLVEHMRRLGAVSNVADEVSWTEGISMVERGEALFSVMGDWGGAQLSEADSSAVDIVPFPGHDENFVYTVDAFAVPRKWDDNGAAARAWLQHVLHARPTMLSFAGVKHALPPIELTRGELEALPSHYQRTAASRFSSCNEGAADCKLLTAVSGLAPASGLDPCFERTASYLAMIAGVTFPDGAFDGDGCETPPPSTAEEAEELFVRELLRVSRSSFAARCREAD